MVCVGMFCFFFFKQKTAYEMRISDWSSDVCSSDLFGVAMLNGIVLIGFLNELRDKGRSVRDAVIQGTALRLRPVLMTASVAILGLVPMLLSSGVGAETQRPLATVVVEIGRAHV